MFRYFRQIFAGNKYFILERWLDRYNLSKHTSHGTLYLTGLRAYAALAVFFIHSGGCGLRELGSTGGFVSKAFNGFVDFGKYGVVIFFVLSAYTISLSLDRVGTFNYKHYIFRRLIRVVPMYYLVITLAFYFGGIPEYFELFKVENDWLNYFYHLSFMNLALVEYRNNLIGVEWTIPIEIFYYFIIPLLFFYVRSRGSLLKYLMIIVGCLLIRELDFLNINPSGMHMGLAYHWSAIKYILCFVSGILLWHLQKQYKNYFTKINFWVLPLLVLLMILFILGNLGNQEDFVALWTCALILALANRPIEAKIFFENRFVVYLGTVSYSFYLIHYPIIKIVQTYLTNVVSIFLISFIITIFFCHFTFKYIEKPIMDLGAKKLV